MRFVKAEELQPGDKVAVLGHYPYKLNTVSSVEIGSPLPAPRGEAPTPGGISVWFSDGSISDECSFPQFLLVHPSWPEGKTEEQVNQELTQLCSDLLGYLKADNVGDGSTQFLASVSEAAHRLSDALDLYYSRTGCPGCKK